MKDRKTLRIVCVICGTVLLVTYAITGANGVLVGSATALLGAGSDILGEHLANRKATET